MSDTLVKAITKGVRVYAAVTTDLVNEAIKRHDCYPVAAAALGRTMTGALLMAANLKNKEAITINIRGNGPLANITADAVPEGYVRGYVANPHVELPLNAQGKLDVGGGVGQGLVTVTRFTGLREPMRGSSEIVSGEIAEDLTNYLYVSEQTPSSIGLGVLVDTDYTAKAAGGFMIQPMPDADEEIITKLEENLKNLPETLILTAEYDPLRDEGEAYGKKLREAGNQVEVCRISGAFHGFFALGFKFLHVQESFGYINQFLNASYEKILNLSINDEKIK